MPKTLEEAVRAFEERCKQIGGCSNHGCVIRPVVGMGTNSICQCWSDKMRMQRFAYAVKDLRAALATDDGTVRVPREPTDAMLAAADDAPERAGARSRDEDNAAIYRAMLAAHEKERDDDA